MLFLYFVEDRYRDERDVTDRRRAEKARARGDRSYDYEDEYRRTSSRNASDRDPKRYPTGHYPPAAYGYDQYYQQQQQYYEQLRRTNPQAYAEWYKRYYAQQMQQTQLSAGSGGGEVNNTDGRESVHSGRSSANDKDRWVIWLFVCVCMCDCRFLLFCVFVLIFMKPHINVLFLSSLC